MKYFIYVTGFLLVSFFASEILSSNDPEPIGAEASLLMLGVFSAFIGLSTYMLVSRVSKISCTKLSCFITGLFSAIVFYGTLALSEVTFLGFYFVLVLALLLTLSVNIVAVFVTKNKA